MIQVWVLISDKEENVGLLLNTKWANVKNARRQEECKQKPWGRQREALSEVRDVWGGQREGGRLQVGPGQAERKGQPETSRSPPHQSLCGPPSSPWGSKTRRIIPHLLEHLRPQESRQRPGKWRFSVHWERGELGGRHHHPVSAHQADSGRMCRGLLRWPMAERLTKVSSPSTDRSRLWGRDFCLWKIKIGFDLQLF